MNNKIVIQTKNLEKSFGNVQVIKNCSMTLQQGSIYGFLGINGAGKTTIFKMLTGLLKPDMGSIEILGSNMLRNRDSLLSKIGSLIETPIFYEHLSAQKNLEIHLDYMGVSGLGVEETLNMVGLSGIGKKETSKFSLGMRQRLGIARAIIHQPQILILDEPINGLDPVGIRSIRRLFERLVNEYNMTILLSSHVLTEIEQTADKIGIIANGKIVEEVDIEQIKEGNSGTLEDYFISLMERENK